MNNKYIIGVDGGTQSSKVVIFDLLGNIVCKGKASLRPMHKPKSGVAEHPDDDLWDSISEACRQAMGRFDGDPTSIIGMGLCTIRCCRALLKADGSLAAPVINWMDLRLSRPYEPLDPEATDSKVRYVTTSSGYITHRFTGEFNDSAANHEGMWPIDKTSWQWSTDPAVLKKFNIPRENLFELVAPATVLGKVTAAASSQTGIPAGIPVFATANDKAVEALGAGLAADSTALISLGTYIGGMVYGTGQPEDTKLQGTKHYFCNMASIPNRYLLESGGIRYGMSTVSWLKDLLGPGLAEEAQQQGIAPEEILNREASQLTAGCDGLMTIPEWLAPPTQPFKRGIMIGLHSGHTRAHIYRSILESIALTMKNHINAMVAELLQDNPDAKPQRIIVSGGGSNSDLGMQIMADVFALPAVRNEVKDAAALGSAICAAVGLNVYESFATAINHMVKSGDEFLPVAANTLIYENINHTVYRDITHFTDPVLTAAESLFSEH